MGQMNLVLKSRTLQHSILITSLKLWWMDSMTHSLLIPSSSLWTLKHWPFTFANNNVLCLVFFIQRKFLSLTKVNHIHIPCVSGFEVPEAPCCQPGLSGLCIPDETPCNDRNAYVFWDAFHPSEAWNLLNAITNYNSTSTSAFTYPMDIEHLVDYEIKMELELTNHSTSRLSATE